MNSKLDQNNAPSTPNELDIHQFALDCTKDFTWHWDLESGTITLYGSTLQHLGFELKNNQSHIDAWLSLVHVDDKATALEKIRTLVKGISPTYNQQYRLKKRDGSWVFFDSSAKVYDYWPNGRCKSIVGHERQIDSDNKIETKLKDITKKYIQSLSSSLDTVWEWDLTTDKIFVSDAWKKLFGANKNEPLYFKKSWGSNIHPEDYKSNNDSLLAVLKNQQEYFNNEQRILFADGQYHWCLVRGSINERDANGRALKLTGIMSNISTQKQKEFEQRQQFEQFSMAMYSTNSSCVEYNLADSMYEHLSFNIKDGNVTQHKSNHTFSPTADTIHLDDRLSVKKFYDSLQNNDSGIKRARWRSKYQEDDYKWNETTARTVEYDDEGKPVRILGIRQNIHDTFLLEQESEQTRAREKAAYKETFHCVWEWNITSNKLFLSDHFINKICETPSAWNHTIEDWEACVHPEDLPIVTEQLEQQLGDEHPFVKITYRLLSIKGDWVWVKGEGQIVELDEFGNPARGIGTIIEITDLKQAELALELEKEFAETTLESINEAVITTDQDGLITSLNRKAEKLLSTDKQIAIGLTLTALCSLNDEHSEQEAQDPIALCISTNMSFNLNHLTLTNKQQISAHIDCSISPLHSTDQQLIGCVMIIRDISRSKQMTSEMEHRAQHDALTDLYNRHAFEKALDKSTSTESYQHILCYLDLDQFKIINDTCGHTAGDELLRQLSAELIKGVRKTDTLARLGGDEFGILIHDCDIDEAFKIATKIKSIIVEHTFHWEDKTFRLGVSIGLSTINPSTSPTLAMQHADAACFSAKEQGRNRIHVYRPDDDEMTLTNGQMGWVPRIQKALQENYFELHAQAIVELQDDEQSPTHFEVLVRLNESGDVIPPGAFLPAAERYNLSSHLDKWVIENTLHTLNKFKHKIHADDVFNINLSAASLTEHGFLTFIQNTFKAADTRPSQICFEITETAAVTNLTAANSFITSLKEMGCQFALDDFGSGLSSFGYLKNFPVDYLKIDGSFVKDITTDPIDAAMVKSINEIGQIMGKKTVAEWVENQTTADMLKEIGVDFAQGYHYSKPTELNKLLTER